MSNASGRRTCAVEAEKGKVAEQCDKIEVVRFREDESEGFILGTPWSTAERSLLDSVLSVEARRSGNVAKRKEEIDWSKNATSDLWHNTRTCEAMVVTLYRPS